MMGSTDLRTLKHEAGRSTPSAEAEQEIAILNMQWREKRDSFHKTRSTESSSATSPMSLEERPAGVSHAGTDVAAATDVSDNGLAAAAATGRLEDCRRILASTGPNVWGPDGTSPLCAAALWDQFDVLQLLLEAAADPRLPNRSGFYPTALHCAALQEHGKICMALLRANADPHAVDGSGVTPTHYASCAEAVWPHFAAVGCLRASKEELVNKGVIRKASAALEHELEALSLDHDEATTSGSNKGGLVKEFSRPGSAYVVTAHCPPRPGSALPPGYARSGSRGAIGSRGGSRKNSQPIDILAEGDECDAASDARLGFPGNASHSDVNSGSLRSLGL
mmetsp:Transcript_82431/g.146120  ORF Transcript_82431/g.146120 Transcript_82431/m.146120 type:complete len:336 (-) Transcript_82431:236-1243(-)